jgi:GTPase SAR1 family protein
VPFILVGLKIDLREDPTALETLYKQKLSPITTDEVPFARTTRCGDCILTAIKWNHSQGRRLAQELGAAAYAECSAMTQRVLALSFVFASTTCGCASHDSNVCGV